MADDWLTPPGVDRLRQAHEALAPASPDDPDEPAQQADGPAPVNLAAPEHRDKLIALFRWAAEGRRWEEIRDEAVALVLPKGRPPEARAPAPGRE